MTFATSFRELLQRARVLGERNPANLTAHCRDCGAPLGILGLAHWPGCDAEPDAIVIRKRRPFETPLSSVPDMRFDISIRGFFDEDD